MSRRVIQRDGTIIVVTEYPEWLSYPDAVKVCECGEHSQTISTAWLVVEFNLPRRIRLQPLAGLSNHVHTSKDKRDAPQ